MFHSHRFLNNADQIDTSRFTGLTSPLWQKYGYDFRGRLNSLAGTGKLEMELRYHHNSNISETFFSYDGTSGLPQNEIEYSYDSLNRLTVASEKREYVFSEEYAYDPDGNIISKIRSNSSNGTFKEMYYDYVPGTNRLDWLNISDDNMGYYEANYSTDSRGNITADEYRSSGGFIYDHRNLPLQVSVGGTTIKYSYDDNGNRLYKEFGSTKEFYLRDHTGQEIAVFRVNGSVDTLQFYNLYGSGLEGRVERNWIWVDNETDHPGVQWSDEPYYYIKDHLGTIRVTIDKEGTVVYAADYWPYGEKMAEYVSGGTTGQKYVFTEKERDTETGYDYFGSRYYDSDLGRWLSVDPLMDKYPGWSPYNYVMGNPLNSYDPDGKEVRLNNRKDADRLAKEINAVLGGEHVFVVEIIINDGDNNQHYFRIDANESSLNWGKDKYLSAAYDIFASREQIFTVIYSETYQGENYSTMKGVAISEFGGGIFDAKTKSIWLSRNADFDNGNEGTVYFHEAIGHGHPVGGENATRISERFGGMFRQHLGGYRKNVGWKQSQLNLWFRGGK